VRDGVCSTSTASSPLVRLVFEMSRRDRRRRLVRKKRKVRDAEARVKADEAYAEERRRHPTTDFSRIYRILLTGAFRSHERGGFQPFKDHVLGPTVTASTSQELEDATNEFYVRAVLGKPEN
jgi:hypothetical protein